MTFNSCKKTDLPEPNKPPTAHAESVLPIQLPRNDIYLVGSGKDPEGKKITYEWVKISGPSSCTILYARVNETKVTDLVAGNYQFELKVTDEEGLFSTDTTEVTVYPASKNSIPKTGNCDISNRTLVETQMTSLGSLSQTREGITVLLQAIKYYLQADLEDLELYPHPVSIFMISTVILLQQRN